MYIYLLGNLTFLLHLKRFIEQFFINKTSGKTKNKAKSIQFSLQIDPHRQHRNHVNSQLNAENKNAVGPFGEDLRQGRNQQETWRT
jgi:hypothetical protein